MTNRILLILAAFLAVGASEVCSQSATVSVDIELTSPQPSCSFSVMNDLDYGSAEKPASGSGSVTISSTTGNRTASGVTASGSYEVGQVKLSGTNVSDYTVSRSFPTTLTRTGGSLTFSGTWAQSSSSSSGYTAISGSSHTGTAGGAGTSLAHYFRFGGTVGGIAWTDSDGEYDGSITASASCS